MSAQGLRVGRSRQSELTSVGAGAYGNHERHETHENTAQKSQLWHAAFRVFRLFRGYKIILRRYRAAIAPNQCQHSGEIDRRVGKTGRNISAVVELTSRAALRYVPRFPSMR